MAVPHDETLPVPPVSSNLTLEDHNELDHAEVPGVLSPADHAAVNHKAAPYSLLDAAAHALIDHTDVEGVPASESSVQQDGELRVGATLTATKSASNPTLNITGAMPHNILEIDGAYWLLYSYRSGSVNTLRVATASAPEGPWAYDSEVLILGDQAWENDTSGTNGGWWLVVDGTYYIFYASEYGEGTPTIGYATASAPEGPYTKYASNPIISLGGTGTWDEGRIQEPSVLYHEGQWIMAYMAEESVPDGSTEKVGIATADAPQGPWTKSGSNPVLDFGTSGAFDDTGAADPGLFYDNGLFWMTYAGLGGTLGAKPWGLGLAHADSIDGPWTKVGQIVPLGAAAAFDEAATWRGSIFRDGDTYHIVYGGIPSGGSGATAKGGNAILNVSSADVVNRSNTTNYTTSSGSNLVAIDSTNLVKTVVTPQSGKRYMLMLQGRWSHDAAPASLFLDFDIDGVSVAGLGENGLRILSSISTGVSQGISVVFVTDILAEGTHTIIPQWRTNTGTATLNVSSSGHLQFAVVEL